MDAIRVDAPNPQLLTPSVPKPRTEGTPGAFREFLADAVADVNRLQLEAVAANLRLAAGDVDDLHQVMIMTERAQLALEMTMAIRNKLVDAYQEISRMQI